MNFPLVIYTLIVTKYSYLHKTIYFILIIIHVNINHPACFNSRSPCGERPLHIVFFNITYSKYSTLKIFIQNNQIYYTYYWQIILFIVRKQEKLSSTSYSHYKISEPSISKALFNPMLSIFFL